MKTAGNMSSLPARSDDKSEDHLKWLVKNRSRNQQATLALYLLIENESAVINGNLVLSSIAQELAAIAFSLWRAVFLSDLGDDPDAQMLDLSKFLGDLISHNAIAYVQDRRAREWTYPYYLRNARLRLLDLAMTAPFIADYSEVEQEALSSKEDWEIAQGALDKAIQRLGVALSLAS